MANKYFNVRQGLQTGNITLDATTGNANVGNLSTTDLNISGNLNSNLLPYIPSGVPSVISLGSASQPFKDLYLSGNITLPGAQTLTANITTAIFSGNLYIPGALTANILTIVKDANITGNLAANNLHIIANAKIDGTLTANTINVDSITVNTQITLNSTINSTSTDTGAFTTQGGVGIEKDLYVGGAIHLANGLGGKTSKVSLAYNDGEDGLDFNFNRNI